jgi:riboflavin synthase
LFTGIVESVGRIERVARTAGGVRLAVNVGRLQIRRVRTGDSVCVKGACLTVTRKRGRLLEFDVSRETLGCTTGLDRPGAVNLERSLRLGDALGGHLVAGHVDGVGRVLDFRVSEQSRRLTIQVPSGLAKYCARKGSICVDGVSLTINRAAGRTIEINLIPHTLAATTLKRLARGARVNLEADLLARYLEGLRASRTRRRPSRPPGPRRRRSRSGRGAAA